MTPQHIPFNGDTYIGPEIRKLIEKWKVKTIIETGTWSAHTTREFAKMGPHVITIDSTWEHLTEEFGRDALEELQSLPRVKTVFGDSSKCLVDVIDDATHVHNHLEWIGIPVLFYLDAHGGGANGSNVNPLLEELDQIQYSETCKDFCIIVIHDFQVPGKDFGYNGGDWGKGFEPLSHELIQNLLNDIYPRGYGYHYNEKADGATRGVIYIYPKEG